MGDKSRFSSALTERAKELRQESTKAEQHAWRLLRNRRMLGLKFRREVPIEDYIVDFYCDELSLVIELDGDVHEKQSKRARDEKRDKRLEELGYMVVRLTNAQIISNSNALVKIIRSLRPSPGRLRRPPSPRGRGE